MKVAKYKSMEIGLTATEYAIFHGRRVLVTIQPDSHESWIKVVATDGTVAGHKMRPRSDNKHPFGASIGRHDEVDAVFAMEEVKSWSPGEGILYGHKPKMDVQPIVRYRPKGSMAPRAGRAVLTPSDPSFTLIKEAVTLLNNFKAQYEEQVEFTIEEHKLVVRFLIQF